jgi:hypothetical protein
LANTWLPGFAKIFGMGLMKALLVPLVAVVAFMQGLAIGKTLEEQFNVSGFILKAVNWITFLGKAWWQTIKNMFSAATYAAETLPKLLKFEISLDDALGGFMKNIEAGGNKILAMKDQLDADNAAVDAVADPKTDKNILESLGDNAKSVIADAGKLLEKALGGVWGTIKDSIGLDVLDNLLAGLGDSDEVKKVREELEALKKNMADSTGKSAAGTATPEGAMNDDAATDLANMKKDAINSDRIKNIGGQIGLTVKTMATSGIDRWQQDSLNAALRHENHLKKIEANTAKTLLAWG